jgi:hypothetical protein
LILFIGASVVPSIRGYTGETSIQLTNEELANYQISTDYVNAYWKFDECSGNTVYDSSEHGYDGTIYGATWAPSGYDGCALIFDG